MLTDGVTGFKPALGMEGILMHRASQMIQFTDHGGWTHMIPRDQILEMVQNQAGKIYLISRATMDKGGILLQSEQQASDLIWALQDMVARV